MIARSAPPFTLRNILDRVGLASMHQGFYREGARNPLALYRIRHQGRRRRRPHGRTAGSCKRRRGCTETAGCENRCSATYAEIPANPDPGSGSAPVCCGLEVEHDRQITGLMQETENAISSANSGSPAAARYWAILEQRFAELGYRDYLGALQHRWVEHPRELHLLLSSHLARRARLADRRQ